MFFPWFPPFLQFGTCHVVWIMKCKHIWSLTRFSQFLQFGTWHRSWYAISLWLLTFSSWLLQAITCSMVWFLHHVWKLVNHTQNIASRDISTYIIHKLQQISRGGYCSYSFNQPHHITFSLNIIESSVRCPTWFRMSIHKTEFGASVASQIQNRHKAIARWNNFNSPQQSSVCAYRTCGHGKNTCHKTYCITLINMSDNGEPA